MTLPPSILSAIEPMLGDRELEALSLTCKAHMFLLYYHFVRVLRRRVGLMGLLNGCDEEAPPRSQVVQNSKRDSVVQARGANRVS